MMKSVLVSVGVFLSLTLCSNRVHAQTYCYPGFQMACFYGDQITRVVFAGINHYDDVCNTDADGKKDFTTTVAPASVVIGSTYTLTVTFLVNSSVGAIAWLDFNRDGVFQTTEAFSLGTRTSNGDLSVNITIPATAVSGTTRLRVMNRKNNVNAAPGAGDACHSLSNYRGQMKDYAVTISAGGALPVELKGFDVRDEEQKVFLSWATETERDNEVFIIQRSENGTDWTTTAEVKGAGSTQEEHRYTLEDLEPFYGTNYYQILQRDKNGAVRLLDRKSVFHAGIQTVVFPNPCGNVLKIIRLEKYRELIVYNLFGEVLQHVQIPAKTTELSLDWSELKSGLYLVVLNNETGSAVFKVTKE